MGIEIVRVPLDFKHPTDETGAVVPGGHLEPLYYLKEDAKAGYQIYENVTEGTPVSPIFASVEKLKAWLEAEGADADRIAFLLEHGHAPSFITRI